VPKGEIKNVNDMVNRRNTIIMVDDDITNLTVATNNLMDKYNFFTAPSGSKLLSVLDKVSTDMILLDIEMPGMNGYEVIKLLKSEERTADIPVIFLTGKIDPVSEVKGLDLGAVDYITKPFSNELLMKRIDKHLLLERQKKELLRYNHTLESEVGRKTRTIFELQNTILKAIAELVERRDSITGGHIERTQHYLKLLVSFLLEHGVYPDELPTWDIDLFIMSSQLHDVGKISIRDEILMKPGKLSDEEFNEMKKHTVSGAEIICGIEDNTNENDFLKYAKTLAISHHEKWNGTGYPYGLKGNEIPLMGRLMAIIDVYDALTNDRPYKKAFSHEASLEIIMSGFGTHFDPLIENVFLTHENEFKRAAEDRTVIESEQKMRIERSLRSEYVGFRTASGFPPVLDVVSNIVDTRSGAESGLSNRIRCYMEKLVDALKKHERFKEEMSAWNVELLLISAQLHDVGKIKLDDHILYKREALTEDEFESIKAHTNAGVKVIRQIMNDAADGNMLYHAEIIAKSHHEKWDGSGYPLGLIGEQIPLQSRIMAIVDVYDALTKTRPHRDMKTHKQALEIIKGCSGTHFDPAIVEVFLECEKDLAHCNA